MKPSIRQVVLLLALITLPVAAMGAQTSFSGTIPTGTTVTVTPTTIALGTMIPPATYEDLLVHATVETYEAVDWSLNAEDTTSPSTTKGYMYSSGKLRGLTTPFYIWDYTLEPEAYQPIGTGIYTWYIGEGTGSTSVDAKFKQEITRNDLSGSYNIVVTFTWTPA